jgi:hypothetical protein
MGKESSFGTIKMGDKYIRFYQNFHKAFGGKSNSLFELNQSLSSKFDVWVRKTLFCYN